LVSLTKQRRETRLVKVVKERVMTKFVNLYEAKTGLSRLVDLAAAGEEIIISKNGVPHARLLPLSQAGKRRKPVNAMKITYVAPDFDAPDAEIERMFYGE
jgi:prevent-host-death family protein